MYLRQMRFKGWVRVTKTILEPCVAAAVGCANTHICDFPDVKFRVPALIQYRRKQSHSGIQTVIQIGLKS